MIHEALVRDVAIALKRDLPALDVEGFVEACMSDWSDLSLTQRVTAIRKTLEQSLSGNYLEDRNVIKRLVGRLSKGYSYIFIPEYISENGLDCPEEAMEDLEVTTPYSSAEFAVRPFIRKYPEFSMQKMLSWTTHDNEHVRRLASEGCRPKLPWGGVLREFVRDPAPIIPILKSLKDDRAVYVQKSVANNLNDISKDHPELVVELATSWIGQSERTDWILKRGLRTLLKEGHPKALALFGFHSAEKFELKSLELLHPKLSWGGTQEISYQVLNSGDRSKVRLEYRIHFVKKHGMGSKVFQVSESEMGKGDLKKGVFRQSFRDLSTRKHYPGGHRLEFIVNGITKGSLSFELLA